MLTPQASSDTNRYLFSSKELDARSGLQYFNFRYYDPEVGRWLTPDPLGYADGMNRYSYANNNPVNIIDPYGLCGAAENASTAGMTENQNTLAYQLFGIGTPQFDLNQYAPTASQTIGYGATAIALGGLGTALAVPAVETSALSMVGFAGNVLTFNTLAQQVSGGQLEVAVATGGVAVIAELAGTGASRISPLLKEPVSSTVGSVLDTVVKVIEYKKRISALTQ